MPDAGRIETTDFRAAPPGGPPVRVDFAARSHRGRVREDNEDHYLVTRISRALHVLGTNLAAGDLDEHVDEHAYAFVVADGMGGMAAGERASTLAIRTGVRLVLESPRWATRIEGDEAGQLIERMKEYFRKVDTTLLDESQADHRLRGMGTTLTVAYTVGLDAFIVHVGDSRAYLDRGGALTRLTRDHTMAQKLADYGAIRRDEVPTHTMRHMLTNYVGGPTQGVEPEATALRLAHGDRLLLCSDGLTEMVPEPRIASILAAHAGLDAACDALVACALANGGKDNVTVVLARYLAAADPGLTG